METGKFKPEGEIGKKLDIPPVGQVNPKDHPEAFIQVMQGYICNFTPEGRMTLTPVPILGRRIIPIKD